ncbi:MAG: hypothetical protein IJ615_06525 [Bacteroidaceae bacterium]|nr:hypothetical protein [Bacteroidaceae bacterium]
MVFFSLISTAFSCLFYGLVATTAVMAILYAVLRSLGRDIVQTIPFYLTGVVLAVLLTIQFSLLTGAMQGMGVADSAETFIRQQLDNATGIIDAQESRQVMEALTEQFPVIGSFIGKTDLSGSDVTELPEKVHESITGYLSNYIWRRVWWILGTIVVACVVAVIARETSDTKTSKGIQHPSRSNHIPHHTRPHGQTAKF